MWHYDLSSPTATSRTTMKTSYLRQKLRTPPSEPTAAHRARIERSGIDCAAMGGDPVERRSCSQSMRACRPAALS